MAPDEMGSTRGSHEICGFTLLETVVVIALCAAFVMGVAQIGVGIVRDVKLDAASEKLLEQFRWIQALGWTGSQYATVWLDPYDTAYHLTHGTQTLDEDSYPSGINYVDGYLQLPTRMISYDNLGDSQVAGVIRLSDGLVERDIRLYMGVGLQVGGWFNT